MARKPRRPDFEALIERWDAELRRAFLRSVYEQRDRAQLEQIARMIEAGDVEGAIRAVGLDPTAFRLWDQRFSGAFQAGGDAAAAALPAVKAADGMRLIARFDLRNPLAEAWLRDYSSRKIREILDDQLRMVRRYLTESMAAGLNPRTTALRLVGRIGASGYREGGLIGLTESQAGWVKNYVDELSGDNPALALARKLRDRRFDRRVLAAAEGTGEPLSADEIENMARSYANRALRLRAEAISRTEAMAALHKAQSEALDQAVMNGVIAKDAIGKTWRTARDDRVRDSHAAMEGQTVALDEYFTTGDGNQLEYPGDPSGPASEIINCRCWMEPNVDFLKGIS